MFDASGRRVHNATHMCPGWSVRQAAGELRDVSILRLLRLQQRMDLLVSVAQLLRSGPRTRGRIEAAWGAARGERAIYSCRSASCCGGSHPASQRVQSLLQVAGRPRALRLPLLAEVCGEARAAHAASPGGFFKLCNLLSKWAELADLLPQFLLLRLHELHLALELASLAGQLGVQRPQLPLQLFRGRRRRLRVDGGGREHPGMYYTRRAGDSLSRHVTSRRDDHSCPGGPGGGARRVSCQTNCLHRRPVHRPRFDGRRHGLWVWHHLRRWVPHDGHPAVWRRWRGGAGDEPGKGGTLWNEPSLRRRHRQRRWRAVHGPRRGGPRGCGWAKLWHRGHRRKGSAGERRRRRA
mmetsp:Transcript_58318/g.168905  ORF Transcript_58318/g.168905 Transcript_58318/m.168905 type:complete len:351 (+) Transcript_58318:226-1278(+)